MKDWVRKNIVYSIKGKYTIYLVLGVLLASALVGGSSAFLMHRTVASQAASIMNLNCQQEAAEVNPSINAAYNAVGIVKTFARDMDYEFDTLCSDPKEMDKYTDDLYSMFRKIADNSEGCATFFFRHNPDYFSPTGGFLYSRQYDQQEFLHGFRELQPTDFSKFDPDDKLVEWMYLPLRQKRGQWISPYWGDNLQMNMITYVEPVMIGDNVVGVIGMDVNFDQVTARINRVKLYESSNVFIIDKDGEVLNTGVRKISKRVGTGSDEAALFKDKLYGISSGQNVLRYRYRGESKQMAFVTLNNGMKLVMVASSAEIFKERNLLIVITFISAMGVAFVLAIMGYAFTKHLTHPLEELSDTAISVGTGNLNVDIPSQDRHDEVGNLARAFNNTVVHIKLYVDYFQNLAYKDGLTGAQNKAAYDMVVEQVDVDVRMKRAAFAIVMIDLNRLKKINDTFGHEMGNRYIQNLYALITEIFDKDSIYRIGGDEFLVFLRGDAYENREESFAELRASLAKGDSTGDNPWDNVSAASGIAVYNPETDDSVESVFKRADSEMYENKIQMKEVRRD